MSRFRVPLLGLSALALCVAPLAAQQSFDPQRPLPRDPAIITGQLDNGLRYMIRRNAEPENRAELRLVVHAGSILEDEDQLGLAHFAEHMAFNGTRNFQKQELVDFLESLGIRFGPDLNAYTSFDETVYMLMVPTDDAQVLARAFDVLDDWAWGVSFDPEEIDKERGVVIEEWRGRRGANARMFDRQLPVLFQGSRYAERLPIGDPEILASFAHERLIQFYRDWYRPDLMGVVAVGDFDPAVVEALIRERFGRIPMPESPRPRERFPVPATPEARFAIATDPEALNTQVSVYFMQPLREYRTEGDMRQRMVETLYNRMLSARLQEIAQKADAPFLGAGSNQGRFIGDLETYTLGALVPEGGAARGLEALLVEAERVRRHGFTATELERTQLDYLRGLQRAFDERDKSNSAAFAQSYVSHLLNDAPVTGIAFQFGLAQQLVPGIALEEVNALARTWITEENRVILASAPEKPGVEAPTEAMLAAVFQRARVAQVEAYDDAVAGDALMAALPAPGRIVARTRDEATDVHDWRLSNGARVLLKTTDFKDDEVRFQAYAPGGVSLAEEKDHYRALLAPGVLMYSGLGEYSMVDLRKLLAGKVANVAPFIGALEQGLSGTASPADLETLFQLIHLNFTAPRTDEQAIAAFKQTQRSFLENRGANPEAVFSDTLQATLSQYHPRGMPFTAAHLDYIDPAFALDFYRQRFADATGFTFTFVGNVTPEALAPLVEQYIASLPGAGRTESWRDMGVTPPRGIVRRTVAMGLEPKTTTRVIFTGDFEYTDENRLAMDALREALRIRLREVLREDLGGTYGVMVGGSAYREPRPRYNVTIGFGTGPERVEELTTVLFQELERMKEEGPTELDIQKIRETERRQLETSLRQNAFWLGQIIGATREDRRFSTILEREQRAERINADMIRDAARRYLDMENFIHLRLLPEGGEQRPAT
jgi:zinc protease